METVKPITLNAVSQVAAVLDKVTQKPEELSLAAQV